MYPLLRPQNRKERISLILPAHSFRKPYLVFTDSILVKQIHIMGCKNQLGIIPVYSFISENVHNELCYVGM